MVDHKILDVEDQWIKVDKEFTDMIQNEVDLLITSAKMLDYNIRPQFLRNNNLAVVFLYLEKEMGDSTVNHRLDFLMNDDLYLKQIRLNLKGLGEVAIGKANNGYVEPIRRLREML